MTFWVFLILDQNEANFFGGSSFARYEQFSNEILLNDIRWTLTNVDN